MRIKDSALNIVAGGPAKGEKLLAFYFEYLSPFQINNLVAKDVSCLPSVPFFQMVVFQHIIIFVVSGYPENFEGQSCHPVQVIPQCFIVSLPEQSKVAADNDDIFFGQFKWKPTTLSFRKAAEIRMGITGNINHVSPHPFLIHDTE